jgi:acetyl esterase/lipase
MAVGYLVPVAVLAFATACAVWPVARPGRLGLAVFLCGLVVNEVPLVVIGLLVLLTIVTWAGGDLSSVTGWIGLVLTVAAITSLLVVAYRAKGARSAVAGAWREILGDGHRSPPGRDGRPLVVPGAARRGALNPFRRRRRDVERIGGLSYGEDPLNRLDLYRHRSRPSSCPVFIHLHGGRFRSGRRDRESLPLLYRLASHGWLCISADYRLQPAAYPAPLLDTEAVIAWARDHGADYGADPTVVVVAGSSAGAHLAARAALLLSGGDLHGGLMARDAAVTAAVCLSGYYGPADSADPASSPFADMTEHAPPFLVVHGDRDTVVSCEHARRFVADLRQVSGSTVGYAELPGAQHTFDFFRSLRCVLTVDLVEAFLAEVCATSSGSDPAG